MAGRESHAKLPRPIWGLDIKLHYCPLKELGIEMKIAPFQCHPYSKGFKQYPGPLRMHIFYFYWKENLRAKRGWFALGLIFYWWKWKESREMSIFWVYWTVATGRQKQRYWNPSQNPNIWPISWTFHVILCGFLSDSTIFVHKSELSSNKGLPFQVRNLLQTDWSEKEIWK